MFVKNEWKWGGFNPIFAHSTKIMWPQLSLGVIYGCKWAELFNYLIIVEV